MDQYKLTVGLEIHAELKTKTKMFCACKNDPDEERPNHNVCPVCMGHPGTLPVINKEAVLSVLKVGVAIGGKLAYKSEFDRKNYFYPDIPKGYQISQYKHPLVQGGEIAGVKITRVHLEEDTASSSHALGDYSLVNYNRAGVPLMELVTEPVIRSAKEASNFAKELQLLLQYLGVADANMEKGEMRVEANISVSKTDKFGTKVEVKNLNSFKAVEKAIEFEFNRHISLIENGGFVSQETRGWDESKAETYSQRSKEDSHDYRYFPDPDLPKLDFSLLPDMQAETIASSMPIIPEAKRNLLRKSFGIKDGDIEVYITNKKLSELFENSALSVDKKDYQPLSNFICSVVAGLSEDVIAMLSPQNVAEIVSMQSSGELSSIGAKDVLSRIVAGGGSARDVAESAGLIQKNDAEFIEGVVRAVLEANPNVVAEYKSGKKSSVQFLVGQAMKMSKGSANPSVVLQVLEKELGN